MLICSSGPFPFHSLFSYVPCMLFAALLSEIKEISEKKQKEEDVLLTIAVENKRPIIPNLEFDYPDQDIHEDLYHLIKYACREICTGDQSDKVMKIWTTFLEPMLGIPSRSQGAEDSKDIIREKNCAIRGTAIGMVETSGSPIGGVAESKLSDPPRIEVESIPPEQSSPCRVWPTNGDNSLEEGSFHKANRVDCKVDALCKLQLNIARTNKLHGVDKQEHSNERLAMSNVLLSTALEQANGKVIIENASGLHFKFIVQCSSSSFLCNYFNLMFGFWFFKGCVLLHPELGVVVLIKGLN